MAVPVIAPADKPVLHESYAALSRPLTVLGCERRLFLGAACLGAAAFSSFSAPLAGMLLFAVGYTAGLVATRLDPSLLLVILRSSSCNSRYDPAIRGPAPEPVEIVGEVFA